MDKFTESLQDSRCPLVLHVTYAEESAMLLPGRPRCLNSRRARALTILTSIGISTCLIASLINSYVPIQHAAPIINLSSCSEDPWPPTSCFLDRFADAQNRITVVGVNWGYIDMFDDWREMASRVGIDNYVIMAYDNRTYSALKETGRVLLPISTESETPAVEYATNGFRKLTRARPGVLKALLELGYSVFYSDVDTAYRSNPYRVFEMVLAQEEDVPDVIVSEDGAEGYWCSCLLYLTPGSRSQDLIEAWIDFAESDPTEDDQVALNRAKNNITGRYRHYTVPGSIFPSGKIMWIQGYDWARNPQGPVVVHANYLHGHDEKKSILHQPERWNRSQT